MIKTLVEMFKYQFSIDEKFLRKFIEDALTVYWASLMPKFCNFIKKENMAQVFSCEFCKISKNTCFAEQLGATAFTSCHLAGSLD